MSDNVTPLCVEMPETIGPEWIIAIREALHSTASSIVLRGGPSAFCLGLDLNRAASGGMPDPRGSAEALTNLLASLNEHPHPIVAVVEGEAKGAGVGFLAVADVVIAGKSSSFQLPEVLLGLIPAAVLPFVAQRVGWPRARRMALGEPPISARVAHLWGLVDIVSVDPDRDLRQVLQRWNKGEPRALARVRQLVAKSWPRDEAADSFAELWKDTGARRIQLFVNGSSPW